MDKSDAEITTAEDARAHAKIRKSIVYPPEGKQVCGQPNIAYFNAKLHSMRNYRMGFLYDEYKQACDREGLIAFKPSSFNTILSKWRRSEAIDMAPGWFPGELMRTYWTYLSVDTSILGRKHYLFVAYLPYSGLSYLRIFDEVSFTNWMHFCAAAYRYFGGVPHVTEYFKHGDRHKQRMGKSAYDTLRAFTEHYRTVLLHPRPKGEAELSDRLKPLALKRYTSASKYVRDRITIEASMAADELDKQAQELSDAYNRIHKGAKPSIMENFQQVEAPQLLSLPERDYDMAIWNRRHVDLGYHFDQDFVSYSVPWRYAGESVHVRTDGKIVKAYSMGELIAVHDVPGDSARKAIVTDPTHRPHEHQSFANRLEERFMDLALECGPATGAIMREIVLQCQKDGGCWRPCKDLLDLKHIPSGIKLEDACKMVLEREMPLSTESAAQIMRKCTR